MTTATRAILRATLRAHTRVLDALLDGKTDDVTNPVDTTTWQYREGAEARLFSKHGPALLLALTRMVDLTALHDFNDPKLEKALDDACELTGHLADILDLPDDYGEFELGDGA